MINLQASVLDYMGHQPCDMCDRIGPIVVISTLSSTNLCICKECLKEIIEEMEK